MRTRIRCKDWRSKFYYDDAYDGERFIESEIEVRSLAPLAHLVHLREVEVSPLVFINLRPLAALPRLWRVECGAHHRLDPLLEFGALRPLECSSAPYSARRNVAALSHMRQITALRASGTLHVLAHLPAMTWLRTLELSDSYADDDAACRSLEPVRGLVGLRALTCEGCPVEDLAPLTGMRHLRTLDVSQTKVESLQPLASLTKLTKLDISETSVDSLEAIDRLPLTALSCYNTNLTDAQVEDFRARHRECKVVHF